LGLYNVGDINFSRIIPSLGGICHTKDASHILEYKRRFQCDLCRLDVRTLLKYFKAQTGKGLTTGIFAAIQTLGEKINYHPHLHFLLTEGGTDEEGNFNEFTKFDDSLIANFFSREVFSRLLKEKFINLELV